MFIKLLGKTWIGFSPTLVKISASESEECESIAIQALISDHLKRTFLGVGFK